MKHPGYLTLIVCLLALSSCNIFKNSHSESKQASVITDRKWQLVELAGKPVANQVNGKIPYILLQQNNGRYVASSGCNGLGGTFTLPGYGRIKFTQGLSTKMYCENMEIENGLSKALTIADNYSLDGNNLSINKARMAPLARFKAVE
ncbi:META domain-containing protein [Mucilaginibacter sp. Bleaf8]|uniref:META domain-containing protein n=1 Tax=Mucilaginibacter sp. Bleaf8 TaxID=2834430 RepID=UPI001BCC09FB|nr:META domain-containing protein [Mucilaginibacter sp. Bleaf8]MBS7563032.1 META domain-containing protein [Mucilaginibacter sp. Bleaf8]